MNHRPIIHRSDIMRNPHYPEQAVSIDEYIENERSNMSAAQIRKLAKFTPQLQEKMKTDQAQQHFDLQENTMCLVGILHSLRSRNCRDPLPLDLAEAGVAASYLLKSVDIIPDFIPEIGLTDDARLVARVFERNPSLRHALKPI
jgi:uncharacterized membrane protein YkvA (DUF1232 family)